MQIDDCSSCGDGVEVTRLRKHAWMVRGPNNITRTVGTAGAARIEINRMRQMAKHVNLVAVAVQLEKVLGCSVRCGADTRTVVMSEIGARKALALLTGQELP